MLITTPGSPNANSYASIAEADAYNASRPYGTSWASLTAEQKEGALRYSTILLDASFQWTGVATGTVAVPEPPLVQARDFFSEAYRYSSLVASSPGNGQFTLNEAFPYTGVTQIEFHNTNNGGGNIRALLVQVPAGTTIYIQDENDATRFGKFLVEATLTYQVDTVTYVVSYLDQGLAIGNNQLCTAAFVIPDVSTPGPGPGEPNPEQVLCWPRTGMFTRNGMPIDPMVNPLELKYAQAEYARQAAAADITADNEAVKAGLSSVSAGSVSVSFQDKGAPTNVALANPDFAYLSPVVPGAVRLILVPSWYTQQSILDISTPSGGGYMFEVDR